MNKFETKKSIGQNFIIDMNVLNKINDILEVNEEDLVIEIGPGKGALTEILQHKNCKLICIEVDKELKPILDKFENSKTTIIYDNFLKIDLKKAIEFNVYKKLYIVSNIPYYITTKIIKKIINCGVAFTEIILMVQKEYADRICSQVSDSGYNSLTVFLNYYYVVEKLFLIKKKSFYPVPKVDSAMIKMKPRILNTEALNYKHFERLVKDSFLHRRKTLKNNLQKYNFNLIEKYLVTKGKNINCRAQELNLEEYIELSNILYENK